MLKINDCKIIKRSFNLLFLVGKRVKDDSFVNFIFHDCDCVKRKSESIRMLYVSITYLYRYHPFHLNVWKGMRSILFIFYWVHFMIYYLTSLLYYEYIILRIWNIEKVLWVMFNWRWKFVESLLDYRSICCTICYCYSHNLTSTFTEL